MTGWIFIAIAVLLLLVLFGGAYVFTEVILSPNRKTKEYALQLEVERGGLLPGEAERMDLRYFPFKTFDGLSLRCAWLRAEKETKYAVVLVHGFTCRIEQMLRYAKTYRKFGYDVLLFDHRASGESEGTKATMGYLEQRDLADIMRYARSDKGEGAVVGVHGESMGAVTTLLYLASGDKPDFAAADCPFQDLRTQAKRWIRERHAPPALFLPPSSLLLKLRGGFFPGDVSPLRVLEEGGGFPDIPVFFAHGTEDTLIPVEAAKQLYAAKQGKKALHITVGAAHARGINFDREGYEKALAAFLSEHGLLPAES